MTRGLRCLRTRRLAIALLVLPALLLRGLIPVGFMPEVDARGGISIALCPGETALPDNAARAPLGHQHDSHAHQHGSHSSPGAPGATHHAPCLFAASGAAAVTPAMPALTLSVPAVTRLPEIPASGVFPPSILRTQSPRGPPSRA